MASNFSDHKRSFIINCVLLAAIVVIGLATARLRNGDSQSRNYLTFHNEGYISILDNLEQTHTIRYTDITGLQYIADPDFGTAEAGTTVDDHLLIGLWKSSSLGEYIAAADDRINACILIETADGRYVINRENQETTNALFEAINDARTNQNSSAAE
jgi:hypothetical protein